jgi:putative PEP-CTERM system histidine kinase
MATLGTLSYGLAAAAFLVLSLLLATSWEGRAQGARLVIACAITAAWAGLLAWMGTRAAIPVPLLILAEALRGGVWFIVLTGLTRSAGVATGLSRLVHVVWIGGAAVALGWPYIAAAGLGGSGPVTALIYLGLAIALLGLVLLEQIFRNAREAGRYALKFLVIALGVMYAYDLFVYSQALLVKGIEAASWQARGLVLTLLVPLLALAARRNPQWSLNVFVSRQVIFYTTSFVAVGLYLLLMATGGYLIRLYGGTWSGIVQLVFFTGAGIVLLVLLASGTMRRRLRVFLSKHFYRNKYDYRVEWLRFIGMLSTPDPEIGPRENAVRAIAQVIGSPGGLLYLADEEGGALRRVADWPAERFSAADHPVLAADDEFVEFLHQRQWVIDVAEHVATPDLYGNLVLPGFLLEPPAQRFVLPLLNGTELLGFMTLQSPPPPFRPNYEDRDLLKTLGRHVATHLAQHEAARRLAENRQFEAYHRLTAFLMHDLKNLAAQLSLVVANAEKHRRNPEFVDDAIETIANSSSRMQRLIEQLQRREVQTVKRRVTLGEIAERAASRCRMRRPEPVLGASGATVAIEADPERLAMIVEHVIRNAQEATGEEGQVEVDVAAGPEPGWATLSITDDGAGMSEEFVRERLFKPFDTTKGSKGMGIGAYQVREYVQSIGGRVDVQSREGAGTRFSLRLPLAL